MTRRFSNSMSAFNRIALALAMAGLSTGAGLAQDEAGVARRAAARMEEQAQTSMLLLNQARDLYSQKKYKDALDIYRKSLESLPHSPNMEKRRRFLELSIADASIAVAQEYMKVGRLDEAKELLEDALETCPDNKLAKRTLEKLNDPVRTNPALTPRHAKNVEEVNRLLHLAYGYYELGDYDAAIKQFHAVLRIDPYNVAARRGLETVNNRISSYQKSARDEMRSSALADVSAAWERSNPVTEMPVEPASFSEPIRNPILNVNEKLGLIRLPNLRLEGVSVEEAVDYLRNQALTHDTTAQVAAEKGVNITLDPGAPGSPTAKAVAQRRITLNLNDVPLKDALQFVARAAGLEVHTNAYGVELSTSAHSTSYMVTKTISLPPGFFSNLAQGDSEAEADPFADTGSDTEGMKLRRVDPQKALEQMGVNFPEGSFARYNSGSSSLIFHGTPRDLQVLEEVIEAKKSEQPAQIVVTATFLEVSQTDLEELGFNWIVNINLDFSKWFMGGSGTDENDYNNSVSDGAAKVAGLATAPVGNVVGALRTGNQVFTENAIDDMLSRGSSGYNDTAQYRPGGAPSILTMRGVWTEADVTMIMRGLDQKKSADVLQHPSVIVRPGEKASFFCGEDLIYPTEYEPPEILENVGGNNNWDNNNWNNNWNNDWNNNNQDAGAQAFTPSHPSAFDVRQLGTKFEVEVTGVSEDKSIVEMTVVPEIVEFDGFINYGNAVFTPVPSENDDNELGFDMIKLSDNLILQPVFSVKRITAPVTVATGHTLVIGSLKKHSIVDYEDKIPILGDIPWVGRLFRSEGRKEERKIIIIMVKANIIDPSGKQIYTPNAAASSTASVEQ